MSSQSLVYFISIINHARYLNRKEKDILVRRLKGLTLEKIGKRYKVSDERIRQIEENALLKLGNKKISQLLLFD